MSLFSSQSDQIVPEPGRLLLDVVAPEYCPKRYSIPKSWCLLTACSMLAQPFQAYFTRPRRRGKAPSTLSFLLLPLLYWLICGPTGAQLLVTLCSAPQMSVSCAPLPPQKNDATAVWASRVKPALVTRMGVAGRRKPGKCIGNTVTCPWPERGGSRENDCKNHETDESN